MITAFLVGDKELIARISAMPGGVRGAVLRTVQKLGFDLQRKVQSEKLSGQVLKVRTGLLRSSINTRVDSTSSTVTATVGTNVKYARIHEYGGQTLAHTILPRRGAALMFDWKGQRVFFKKVEHPGSHIPERSFLRSALREMQPQIQSELAAAVRQEVAKK